MNIQLNLFKKRIFWEPDWTEYEVDSLDGIRFANYDEIPQCEGCKMASQAHPLLAKGGGAYDLLCSLDFIMHPVTGKSIGLKIVKMGPL